MHFTFNPIRQTTITNNQRRIQVRSIDPPIMGWSSWNTYRVNINEDLIKKQADAMVSQGLKEVGYSFVNVDDGFFGYRDEKGVLHAHAERFPNGMKPIADYIHSLGLKAGLYSEAGANTCGSFGMPTRTVSESGYMVMNVKKTTTHNGTTSIAKRVAST